MMRANILILDKGGVWMGTFLLYFLKREYYIWYFISRDLHN